MPLDIDLVRFIDTQFLKGLYIRPQSAGRRSVLKHPGRTMRRNKKEQCGEGVFNIDAALRSVGLRRAIFGSAYKLRFKIAP